MPILDDFDLATVLGQKVLSDEPHVRHVVGNQHPGVQTDVVQRLVLVIDRRRGRRTIARPQTQRDRFAAWIHRQGHGEGTADPLFALNRDPTVHRLEQSTRDRQPQPGAAEPLGDGGIGLHKWSKQTLHLVRRHADPGVLDLETQLRHPRDIGPRVISPQNIGQRNIGQRIIGPKIIGPKIIGPKIIGPRHINLRHFGIIRRFLHATRRQKFHRHIDPSAGRKFERVGNQVDQNLSQPIRIGCDRLGQIRSQMKLQFRPIFFGPHVHRLANVIDQFVQSNLDRRRLEFANLDPRQIQHIVDQSQQIIAVAADRG